MTDEVESRERGLPPTERRHPASRGIDARDARGIAQVMWEADRDIGPAVRGALDAIAPVIDAVHRALRAGGALVYVGAGTSGRLAVLDASECPPTFGVSPRSVRAIIAGGDAALRSAIEGAEDDRDAGTRAIAAEDVSAADVVCGVAASGTTPFVRAALEEAHARGATTALIHCHPGLERAVEIDHDIALDVGPEIIAGSTRLKSGTATKMVLNMITTGAMIRWGKVYDNLMVDVAATNEKLRRRAVRLVREIAEVDAGRALDVLTRAGGNVKSAIVMARAGVDRVEAEARLAAASGSLRRAMEA